MTSITRRDVLLDALAGAVAAGLIPTTASAFPASGPGKLPTGDWETFPCTIRCRWTRLGPDAARWQQAFSLDGQEWETNWIIEHRRVKENRS